MRQFAFMLLPVAGIVSTLCLLVRSLASWVQVCDIVKAVDKVFRLNGLCTFHEVQLSHSQCLSCCYHAGSSCTKER